MVDDLGQHVERRRPPGTRGWSSAGPRSGRPPARSAPRRVPERPPVDLVPREHVAEDLGVVEQARGRCGPGCAAAASTAARRGASSSQRTIEPVTRSEPVRSSEPTQRGVRRRRDDVVGVGEPDVVAADVPQPLVAGRAQARGCRCARPGPGGRGRRTARRSRRSRRATRRRRRRRRAGACAGRGSSRGTRAGSRRRRRPGRRR